MPVRRVRGSPFADIDAYLAQQGLLSAATGTEEVGKVQVPIFSQNHRQSRVVPRASPRQGRSKKSQAASRPVASPQVTGGAIIETTAMCSRQSSFANPWDLHESNVARCASGPSRVMATSNGCPALEDAKDGKGSAGSVEDSSFDPSSRLDMGQRAPPTRSKHFPNSDMSQPETPKKPQLDLSSLSAEQREAISEPLNRPLLILAGPGSGKTHFLVTRIRQALSESVPAEGIIAVTYTRKAADELSHRVKQHAGDAGLGAKVWVSTVHGLALRFLREAGGRSGAPCKAASEEDRRAAAGVVLGQPQLQELFSYLEALPDSEGSAGDAAQASKKYGQTVAKLLSVFDQKGRWLANSVQDVSQQPLLVTAHQAFLQELRKQRLLDISEVIEAASRLQQADAESSSRWVASFAEMLFVDEWQDIDTEQQDFLARLLGRQGHITAVGDDDQRIYAWRDRGASAPEAFRKHWSSACIKTLGANHRALPHLVEAATRLISHNSHREKKELRSARHDAEQSGRVSVVAKECLNAEARWVAEEIQRGGDAKSSGTCAILTRTNVSATVFAKALSQLGLPVWPSARKGVTDGPRTSQVLDLLAYLRLVVDPHHDPSFLRICNVPRRGVGKAALRCLREQFGAPAETSLSTFQGVEDLNVEQAALRARSLAGGVDGEPASGSFEGAMGRLLKAPWLGSNMRLAQGLATLAAVLRAARRAAAAEHGAADVLRVILAETGLGSGSGLAGSAKAKGSWRKAESTEALASPASPGLQQLMAAAEKYVDGQNGAACVVRFLQEMAPRGAGHAASTSSTSSVFVSTIHQAKGLEWNTVFLVQCNEMVMPLQRQGMQMADEQLEEERRLFYVAMTRARNRLVLSFSLKRDSGEAAEPSRFLFESGAMDTDTMDPTDPMHTLHLGDGDIGSVGIATNPEPPLKRRKTNEFFQTGLEVQRSVKEAQVLPGHIDSAPSGMQSWIPKALESEQALCASFFGTDCLQK